MDDLVKRLRSLYFADEALLEEVADSIEELEADRRKTYEALLKVTRIHDELEAKLAKAVEALGRIKRGDFSIMTPPAYVTNPLPSAQEIARTTLAELKGQKNE